MSYEAAPFWRRLAARILDLAFCLVLTFMVAVPVSVLLIPLALLIGDAGRDLLAGWAAALCYFIAYVGLEVFLSAAGSNPDSGILNGLAWLGMATFTVSLLMAAVPLDKRRAIHDLAAGGWVVRAANRKIDSRNDLWMMMPGRVDLTKQ